MSADSMPRAGLCLSHGEAKRVYRGAYLHWHRGTHGRRCWGQRGALRLDASRKGSKRNPPAQVAFARVVDEKQQPENEELRFAEQPMNILDHPSWAWVEMARLNPTPIEFTLPPIELNLPPVFSSFAGVEPDVWPQIETVAPWRATVAGIMAALLAAAMAGVWLSQRPSSQRTRP